MIAAKPALWFLANRAVVQVDGDETGGAWSAVELTGAHGDMPPLHKHDAEEAFYVLDGELTLLTPGTELRLRTGECAVTPRGVSHVYRVESEQARWLALCSPSGFERFVAELSAPAESDGLPPHPTVDPELVAAVAAKHGIEILGPPGALP